MKRRKGKLSVRTIALIAVAVILLASGGVMTARAQLQIFSPDIESEFGLDDLSVALIENGKSVNTGDSEADGKLIERLHGKVDPGRVYKEEISAKNNGGFSHYLRLRISRYWKGKNGKKDAKMDPSLIELTYGNSKYNSSVWQINKDESTAESDTYYYSSILKSGQTTEPVVNRLRVSDRIVSEKDGNFKVSEKKEGNKTIYTYEYKYNGYRACIEADVQALQTHNVNDAIRGIWGVQNVSVSDGHLSVH